MMRKERLHIGLMIHHLENEYATELLRSAMFAAEELDINLTLLPGRGINAVEDDEKYSIYDYQYNVIYHYVSKSNLDALIVSAGTIGSYISQKEMLRFLRGYEGLPILTMEVEYPGYPCVHFNANGMKLAVDHLIDDCGMRKSKDRLCFRHNWQRRCNGTLTMLSNRTRGSSHSLRSNQGRLWQFLRIQ